jgi:hypothetical protein
MTAQKSACASAVASRAPSSVPYEPAAAASQLAATSTVSTAAST